MHKTIITELPELTSVSQTQDYLPIVDGSDTTESNDGSTKKVTVRNILGGKALPSGDLVGTSDIQTLTNKTLTNPDITGGSIDGADITGGSIDGAEFVNGEIKDTDITNGNINDASIVGGSISGSTNVVEVLKKVYPVGCIYTSTVGTNPAILFGFGSWSAHGEGRVLVGKASSGTFSTAGATGGAEEHLHGLSSGSALIGSPSGNADALGFRRSQTGSLSDSTYSVGGTGHSASGHPNRAHNTRLDGTTDNGSSLPPYLVVYFFKRDS